MGVSVQNSALRTNYLFPDGNATKIIRRVILYNGIVFKLSVSISICQLLFPIEKDDNQKQAMQKVVCYKE